MLELGVQCETINAVRFTLALSFALVLAGCPSTDGDEEFRIVVDELPGSITSFWGTSSTDLFAVGGEIGPPGEALILWHDGNTWARMPVDGPTLWWVHGFAHDDVFAVGEGGTVVHFDGTAWTTLRSGSPYTLWGIWGSSPTDIWAVGGDVMRSVDSVLLHYDGTTWTEETSVSKPNDMYFKIWGSGADDVWAVSERGVIIHYDGTSWSEVTTGNTKRLITVNGTGSNDVYAVGGVIEGVLLHYDGTSWQPEDTGLGGGLLGVWPGADSLFVAGFSGLMGMRENGVWRALPFVTSYCLHATWGNDTGVLLAGGGNLLSGALDSGIIVGRGDVAGGPIVDWSP